MKLALPINGLKHSTEIEVSPLYSRLLRACYYDLASGTLALKLRVGGWRVYPNVDAPLVQALVSHPYPGHFYESVLVDKLSAPLRIWNASRAALLARIWLMRYRTNVGR